MKSKRLIIPMALILLSASFPAFGRILFEEDFESDTIGQDPANFEELDSPANRPDPKIEVVNDPEGKSGKTAEIFTSALYVPIVAGRDDWTDWYWEWDQRWDIPCNVRTAYRIIDPSNFFHFSPRSDMTNIGIWQYLEGGWIEVAIERFPLELETWYRFQIVMKGAKHTVRIKERADARLFDGIEPAIEVEDNTFEKGAVSVMGVGPDGTSWLDNFIVYEEPEDLLVDHNGRLAVAWGKLKAER